MKKATKILCGVAGILALIEVTGTLGEVQALWAMSDIEPEATERMLDTFANKDLHKHLNIGPYTSAKCRFISRFTKALMSIDK